MKQIRQIAAFFAAMMILWGCTIVEEPEQAQTSQDGTGLVRVTLHVGDARTALPVSGTIGTLSRYTVTFSKSGESPVSQTITTPSLSVNLIPGNYTLNVIGYDNSNRALAEGTATMSIIINTKTDVAVQLYPTRNETGTFSYTVTIPGAPLTLETGTLLLTSLSGGTNSSIDLTAAGSLTGSLTVSSGYYQVSVSVTSVIEGSSKTAAKTQIAHIYDNLETAAAYTFIAEDFTEVSADFYVGNSTELTDALTAIRSNTSKTDFTILITADFSLAPVSLTDTAYAGKTITIGSSIAQELSLISSGSLFTVGSSSVSPTLILQNITLKGLSSNNSSLIKVNGGTLVLKSGGTITGNTSSASSYGGGVYVGSNGTFTMEGGEISGNSASSYYGGGVYVSSGTFTMKGGEISGNSASSYGGGVFMYNGTFTMKGGEISGNSASSYGGGVYMYNGTFTMEDGTITGNSASSSYGGGVYMSNGTFTMEGGEISGNSASSYGGGVYVSSGTFTKAPAAGSTTSGIIYGSDASVNLKNTANYGAAVYYTSSRRRSTTVGETERLSTTNSDNWTDPLLPPADVNALPISFSSIDISWSSASDASSYRVYRATSSSGTYTQIGSSSGTTYTDTGLSPETTYYYKVSTYNSSSGESALSSYVSATTPEVGSLFFAWTGSWTQMGTNKYNSNSIGNSANTWETLTISAPAACTITVTLTASSESGYDYGYASMLDGSQSTSSYQFRVSGDQSQTYTYTVSEGTHYLYFGYVKDGSQTSGSDRVTVEVTY